MASVGSLAPSRPSARRVARKRRPPARRARRLPARASSASSGRATSDAPDVVAVRYGLLNGSVAYYPRSDASSPSSPSARRRDTAPTTRYDDGPLDAAAIALFNAKLRAAVEDDADGFGAPLAASTSASALPPLPPGGFPLLVALADRIARSGRPPAAQRQVVLATLLGLIPRVVRDLFKILIRPAPWVDRMNAKITVAAFAWLVGPCEIVPRESDGALAAVKLRKCRYLEQCGCVASCANFCKAPTQSFFAEAFGVDAHLAPNHADGSCVMTFGEKPPSPDPAFEEPCYAACARATSHANHSCEGGGDGAGVGGGGEPCHRLGEPPRARAETTK